MVITIISVLAAFLLPALARAKEQARRAQCISNLKQIALAFRSFAIDHDGHYPWQTSLAEGGTYGVDAGESWRNFRAASNELDTPKILLCPSDRLDRIPALGWNNLAGGLASVSIRDRGVSYFTGLDCFEQYPSTFLAGDRNIQGTRPENCRSVSGAPGVAARELNPNNAAIGWTNRIHGLRGCIAFSDSSVQVLSQRGLREAIEEAHGELASKQIRTISGAVPDNHILPPK